MIILACETSTLLGSVAILENEKVLAYEQSPRQGSHSDILNIFIERVLLSSGKKLSDIDLFVSGIGPGSFTGIRISLNTIKTLAYCLNKPVLGINSLQTLAAQCFLSSRYEAFKSLPVVAMINAYKNMVYVATYRFQNAVIVEVKAPEVIRVQSIGAYLTERSIVCGAGFLAYEKYISESGITHAIRVTEFPDEPHAKYTGVLAYQKSASALSWSQLLPLYLRSSEAEENLLGIKYQPLY